MPSDEESTTIGIYVGTYISAVLVFVHCYSSIGLADKKVDSMV